MKKEKKISDHRIFSDLSEEKRECVQENFDYILDEIKNWLKTNDEKYFFKLKKAGTNKERMFWYIMLRENVLNDLKSQVLVYGVTLKKVEGDTLDILLSHFGKTEDLTNLLNINDDFKGIDNSPVKVVSYKYNNT